MKDSDLREMAKNRVEFRDHFHIYIIVNTVLAVMNIYFSPQFLWFLFPVVFWGIGLMAHYREAYCGTTQRRIEKEYQKLKASGRKGK